MWYNLIAALYTNGLFSCIKSLLLVFLHYALFLTILQDGKPGLRKHFGIPMIALLSFFLVCVLLSQMQRESVIYQRWDQTANNKKNKNTLFPLWCQKKRFGQFSRHFRPFLDENNFWPQISVLFDTFTNHLLNITQRGSLNWFFFCPW